MARRPTAPTRLNAANLTRLGAPRLAELLAEASVGDANLKRRLRLELAAEAGPDRLAAEIDKRIAALAAARVRVSWRKRGELIRDLEAHRRMIVDRLAPADARAAFASLLAWFDLFRGLTARVQDPRGELVFAFEDAGWDVTEKRRPLRMLGHYALPLWLAIRGVAGELPFQAPPAEASDNWATGMAADAKAFRKR